MSEDYSKARTLATVEYLGVTFRVVRRRFDGKHWRGYLTLLHGDTPVTDGFKSGDPETAATEWLNDLSRLFKSREAVEIGLRAVEAAS